MLLLAEALVNVHCVQDPLTHYLVEQSVLMQNVGTSSDWMTGQRVLSCHISFGADDKLYGQGDIPFQHQEEINPTGWDFGAT
jgi:hypothetical protein